MSRTAFRRAGAVAAILIAGAVVYLYLSITILDQERPGMQLVELGMTKSQVVELVGPPDWVEAENLWAYRVRGDGISGILVPYYFTFDADGVLLSVHS